jgi:plastocyanin
LNLHNTRVLKLFADVPAIWVRVLIVAFAFGSGGLLPVTAATTNVTVESFDFVPALVTIKVNDSVKWVWTGNSHSTTSDDGLWNSGLHSTGFTFTNKFTTAGSFNYLCTAHTFMVGTVTVVESNSPPTVALTNPPSGSVFSAPATIRLAASASDSGGSVTNVQFFQGVNSNLVAAAYTFSAVASDNTGLKATNSVTVSVISPSPLVIGNALKPAPSQFRFDFAANAGLRYVIERSSTLSSFLPLATNTAAASSIAFTDSVPGLDKNFYRVGRLPNP